MPSSSPPTHPASSDWYQALVAPRRIAVVGASSDPAKGGLLRNLVRLGFTGEVVPVNPRGGVIEGLPVAAAVGDISGQVDLALIVVPAKGVPAAVRDCADAGVTVAYVMSSGFGELGAEGRQLEQAAVAEASRTGLRLLGPNTNGMICAHSSVVASIMTTVADLDAAPPASEIALISQSGAIGAFVLSGCQEAGLPVGVYFSTGNEADVGFEELLGRVVDDPRISVVLTYVEGLRDGPAFVDAALRAAALGKTIVMLKVGTTEAGARASASHTAAMAGSDAVYDGVLRQLGVCRASDLQELVHTAQLLAAPRRPAGRRLGVVTISGGLAVMATDAAVSRSLTLPEWSAATAVELGGLLPAYLDVHNPLDTSGVLADDPQLLRSVLGAACRDEQTDVVLLCLGGSRAREESVARTLVECAVEFHKPVVVVWVGGARRIAGRLAAARIPCFGGVEDAIAALDVTVPAGRAGEPSTVHPAVPDDTAVARSRALIEAARERGQTALDEVDGKAILRAWGIPAAAEVVVEKVAAVAEAVVDLQFPLVAKLRSSRLPHKSDAGGVILGLDDAPSALVAVERLLALASGLGLDDADVVLQEQVDIGVELILGSSVDPTFGPVMTVGIGGVTAEVSPDVQVRLPTLERRDVLDALGGLRSRRLVDGFRGAAPVPRETLADVTVAFARMAQALAPWITEIDVNPLVVRRAGGALVAVDALMVIRGEGQV